MKVSGRLKISANSLSQEVKVLSPQLCVERHSDLLWPIKQDLSVCVSTLGQDMKSFFPRDGKLLLSCLLEYSLLELSHRFLKSKHPCWATNMEEVTLLKNMPKWTHYHPVLACNCVLCHFGNGLSRFIWAFSGDVFRDEMHQRSAA